MAAQGGQSRLHARPVVLLRVADPPHHLPEPIHPTRAAVGPALADSGALPLRKELVGPPGDRHRRQVDVEAEAGTRLGGNDRARRRPASPPVPIAAPETGARPGAGGPADPAARPGLRAPL